MNNFLNRWDLNQADILALAFVLILIIFSIFLALNSPDYKYIICQDDVCVRANTYKIKGDNLEYTYGNRKGIFHGNFTIKDK
jgi:lipopolysaccharide assembly outer membrane protein LptD (OstA)